MAAPIIIDQLLCLCPTETERWCCAGTEEARQLKDQEQRSPPAEERHWPVTESAWRKVTRGQNLKHVRSQHM